MTSFKKKKEGITSPSNDLYRWILKPEDPGTGGSPTKIRIENHFFNSGITMGTLDIEPKEIIKEPNNDSLIDLANMLHDMIDNDSEESTTPPNQA